MDITYPSASAATPDPEKGPDPDAVSISTSEPERVLSTLEVVTVLGWSKGMLLKGLECGRPCRHLY